MIRILLLSLTLIASLLSTGTTLAIEPADNTDDGKVLHDQYCQRCHDNAVYTRPDSIIFSLTALEKRVRFCESMAAAAWSEPQMKAVITYLNQRFYHFKR